MHQNTNRIQSLCEAFVAFLDQEANANGELWAGLEKGFRAMQEETRDPRLPRMLDQIRQLRERSHLFSEMAKGDFADRISEEARGLEGKQAGARLGRLLNNLIRSETAIASSKEFFAALLDELIAETGAKRGFLLLYLPESTEAEVISARHFQTTHLSASEYGLSRTVVRQVLEQGRAVVLDDATQDSRFATSASIRELKLLSILAVPLKENERVIGAIYLDNQTLAAHFDADERQLVEDVANFAVVYLRHARLLPVCRKEKRSVFLDAARAPRELMGNHPKILEVLDVVRRVADKPATVLIEGESGTGKELVARALHYESCRADQPFVAINCAAIPRDLLESELFGHEKGAFTGATSRLVGQIQEADGGTLFLDEVSELDTRLQAKLYRFLQFSEFRRLGNQETQKVNVRVVAATSKNLPQLIQSGEFQAPLYHRLHVVPIQLPALRERQEDIPVLVDHFLKKHSSQYGDNFEIQPEVIDVLCAYSFPGNVRELENLIQRLMALATGTQITVSDLPAEVLQHNSRISLTQDPLYQIFSASVLSLEDLRLREERARQFFEQQKRELGERAVQEADGNVTAAAAKLRVHRTTLHEMIKKERAKE